MWLRLRLSLVEPRGKVEHSLTFFVWLSVIPMRINRQILKNIHTPVQIDLCQNDKRCLNEVGINLDLVEGLIESFP